MKTKFQSYRQLLAAQKYIQLLKLIQPSFFMYTCTHVNKMGVSKKSYLEMPELFRNQINANLLGKVNLIWQGEGDEDIETRSLKFQQPPSLAVQFFRSPPPLLLVLKYTNFRSPPFGCLNIFGAPPQYLHALPLSY